jgi:glyoxylase-like metal-dependent hydrolase (beta-lactamase superfamily II)
MHPDWLSNSYLVADRQGGAAVFVDSGGPMEPLLEAARGWDVEPTHILRTHAHPDHVAHESELGLEVVTGPLEVGGLHIEALPTPGHAEDHLAFVVNGELSFTGDILFKDTVGGGRDVAAIRRSVMDVLMPLPHETRVLPGHTDETTIGREWEKNPFVRVWRGVDPEGDEPCRVGSAEATIVVWSPDYDGKGKALIRFSGGEAREVIVGGSRVERG